MNKIENKTKLIHKCTTSGKCCTRTEFNFKHLPTSFQVSDKTDSLKRPPYVAVPGHYGRHLGLPDFCRHPKNNLPDFSTKERELLLCSRLKRCHDPSVLRSSPDRIPRESHKHLPAYTHTHTSCDVFVLST